MANNYEINDSSYGPTKNSVIERIKDGTLKTDTDIGYSIFTLNLYMALGSGLVKGYSGPDIFEKDTG